jgi:hypothetical protein
MRRLLLLFASGRDEGSAERCGFGLNGAAVKPSRRDDVSAVGCSEAQPPTDDGKAGKGSG